MTLRRDLPRGRTTMKSPSKNDAPATPLKSGSGRALEAAESRVKAAKQRLRLAKSGVKQARKQFKEAKREAKRLRKRAAAEKREAQRAVRQARTRRVSAAVTPPAKRVIAAGVAPAAKSAAPRRRPRGKRKVKSLAPANPAPSLTAAKGSSADSAPADPVMESATQPDNSAAPAADATRSVLVR